VMFLVLAAALAPPESAGIDIPSATVAAANEATSTAFFAFMAAAGAASAADGSVFRAFFRDSNDRLTASSVPVLPTRGPRVLTPGATRTIDKRGTMTLQQRLLLITQVADKVPSAVLAERHGVTPRSVARVYAQREHLWAATSAGVPHESRCTRFGRYPLIDKELMRWFLRMREEGIPVSRFALQVKAGSLAAALHPGIKFGASNGYVELGRKRRAVRSILLHGSGGGARDPTTEIKIAALRKNLVGIDPGLILNTDEVALFYQLAPTNSYVLSLDARETRGTALQSLKARITVIFCINATGTFKFLSEIGRAVTPVCFRGRLADLPVKYYSQRNGCMDKIVYPKWRADLAAFLRDFTSSPTILLLDNASGNSFPDEIPGVQEEKLPPNSTAFHRPCYQGFINTSKTTYRRKMMAEMLRAFDEQLGETTEQKQQRRAAQAGARPGSLGLANGRSPHVLDAMTLIKEAFD